MFVGGQPSSQTNMQLGYLTVHFGRSHFISDKEERIYRGVKLRNGRMWKMMNNYKFDLDMDKMRDELWYQYQAEVATLERFGQRNVISFDEWLVIKGYCKNETRAGL